MLPARWTGRPFVLGYDHHVLRAEWGAGPFVLRCIDYVVVEFMVRN